MSRKAITVRDVAKEANVSIATVSRVLNGRTIPGNVTSTRVLKAAQKVGYSIKSGQSECRRRTVLAIIHDRNVGYLDTVLNGVHRAAKQLDYDVAVHVIREADIAAKTFSRLAKNVSASGVIFVSACVPTEIMNTIKGSLPVVKCIDVLDDDDITCLGIDDRAAFRALASYLISTGRSKIAMVRSPLMGDIIRYREEGFREAMRINNKPVKPEWISPMIQRDGEIADFNHVCYFIKTLIDGSDRPNAIMCNIDTDAAMVMKAIYSLGLRVPEDMAVTGFYNLLISRLVHPELTTVETRAADIGYTAMKMLDERIANPSLPHTKIYTNAEIIVRKSTSTF